MKIEKAIEIKSRTGDELLNTDPDKLEEADRLSIEALKRIQQNRTNAYVYSGIRLPGETEE